MHCLTLVFAINPNLDNPEQHIDGISQSSEEPERLDPSSPTNEGKHAEAINPNLDNPEQHIYGISQSSEEPERLEPERLEPSRPESLCNESK